MTTIDWGSYKGRKRKPCPEDPVKLTGQPIGQFHCPSCGDMQLAAVPHLPPDDDYEEQYGMDWPPGYEEAP